MKKLLIVTNVLTIVAFMFFAGCNGSEPAEPVAVVGATNCYPAATSGTQFNGLSALLAYKLAKNYKNNQLVAINNALFPGAANGSDGDARSVWFDLETLKRFIYEIESQTCGKCNNSSKVLGVRIYYGAYPDSTAWSDSMWTTALAGVPSNYAGKHTVMLVPTYHNAATNAEIDFDPKHVTTGCNFTNIESFYETMKEGQLANVTLTVLSGMSGTAQNHGQMIPPPYGSNDILEKGAGIMFATDNTTETE